MCPLRNTKPVVSYICQAIAFAPSAHAGSPPSVHPSSLGSSNVIASGDKYQVTADVSQFEPQDIVVTTYNYCIVIQAEKVRGAQLFNGNGTNFQQFPSTVQWGALKDLQFGAQQLKMEK